MTCYARLSLASFGSAGTLGCQRLDPHEEVGGLAAPVHEVRFTATTGDRVLVTWIKKEDLAALRSHVSTPPEKEPDRSRRDRAMQSAAVQAILGGR